MIIRYNKEEGLPATQRGRLYFIEVENRFAWHPGRTGAATLTRIDEAGEIKPDLLSRSLGTGESKKP